ncbi:hypothetical protein DFH08DRAFT_104052 [Mycena albidolilacea]|uniref:Uncharacterized protein n=1 Tax=Mycena albidolilacea TaxID=1033008 RepID=A0AAD7E6Z6_9AGAR|nr:hypothetical protein DFH08DRAFT_104052 [Mycena albidolilacea]
MSVKDMALGDWAPGKILDEVWLAPADMYFGKQSGLENPELGVCALHPVSWFISPPSSPPHPSTASSALPTSAASAPAPATPELHRVVLPGFKNVVRRLIVECALDAAGPQRGGMPPTHTRTVEPPSPRLAKRCSNSAELDDVETASTGSAPKRARLDNAESPAESSTPTTGRLFNGHSLLLCHPSHLTHLCFTEDMAKGILLAVL